MTYSDIVDLFPTGTSGIWPSRSPDLEQIVFFNLAHPHTWCQWCEIGVMLSTTSTKVLLISWLPVEVVVASMLLKIEGGTL